MPPEPRETIHRAAGTTRAPYVSKMFDALDTESLATVHGGGVSPIIMMMMLTQMQSGSARYQNVIAQLNQALQGMQTMFAASGKTGAEAAAMNVVTQFTGAPTVYGAPPLAFGALAPTVGAPTGTPAPGLAAPPAAT